MVLLCLFATPLIVLVLHLGPGLFVLRHARLKPAEKLVASLALSGILVYLAGFVGYLSHHPRAVGLAMIGLSLAALLLSFRTLRELWANRHTRRIIFATLFLTLWCLLLMSIVRSFNGALWAGDWLEHYQRAMFFERLRGIGVDFKFINLYSLPARPPLQNVVTAVALAPSGDRFESFAYATTCLSVLIAPAGMLLLPSVARRGRRAIWIFVCLLLLSPMFAQNATFTWTKLYAGFYGLVGLWFYLRAYERTDRLRLTLSAIFFAAGVITHYSIATYVLVLSIPYAIKLVRAIALDGATGIAFACAAALGFTWFEFSFIHFGVKKTLSSNTSVIDASELSALDNIKKVATNFQRTMIPMWPRDEELESTGAQIGYWRDRAFLAYMTNLPFMAGLAGLPLIWASRFWKNARPSIGFWLYYIGAVVFLGIASHGAYSTLGGLGHVSHTPLIIHALCAAAIGVQRVRLRGWRVLLAIALSIDVIFGIVIHFWLQSRFVIPVLIGEQTRPDIEMTATAFENSLLKSMHDIRFPFDHWLDLQVPLIVMITVIAGASICYVTVLSTRRVRS